MCRYCVQTELYKCKKCGDYFRDIEMTPNKKYCYQCHQSINFQKKFKEKQVVDK